MAGRITSLSVQMHNPDRANVYIDGEFAFGLAMVEAAKLSTGQLLTDADIEALKQFDEVERAHEAGLNLLSYRPRSEQEVRRRLGRKGFSEAAIEEAVQRLLRAKLLDDEAFARYWISNREQFRPRGEFALRQELQRKGISLRIIDGLLEDVDEAENAYRAATKRLARWQRMDPGERERKLSGYLARRGFSYDVIRDVWERLLAEELIDQPEND
jgi:regulatory protein